MFINPYFLAVFSAGNHGSSKSTIDNPGLSKNCITIGAAETQTPTNVASFSSVDPAVDGRYGVDVIAPGYSITSARASGSTTVSSCATTSKAGTSMAAPNVAGSAALIRQYFMDTRFWASNCKSHYPMCRNFEPLASTVKGVLINSAFPVTYMFGVGTLVGPPSIYQGFGHINMKNTIPLTGVTSGLDLYVNEINMTEGMSVVLNVNASSTTVPLR
jgi:serine protease AprX